MQTPTNYLNVYPGPEASQGSYPPYAMQNLPDPIPKYDVRPRTVGDAVDNERRFQTRQSLSGLRDATLSLTVMGSGGMLQLMHDQYENAKQFGIAASNPDIYSRVAELPVDWRSMAGAAGVLFTKSAIARMRDAERFAHADARGDGSVEQLVTVDPAERRRTRIMKRIGRGAITLAMGFVAYNTAKHVSPAYSMESAIVTASTGMAGVTYARMRTEQVINRRRGRHYH